MGLPRSLSTFTFCFIVVCFAERICERQGTCKRCDGHGRYSYYSCSSDGDCFQKERCRDGFCCPKVNASFFEDPETRPFSTSFFDETSISGSACPDGSSWMRLCKSDLDCLFNDEVCALGKCCSSCIARRRQILREHPPEFLVGIHVPQCSEDGRFYQMRQCVHGFPMKCFCTSLYGERVNPVGIQNGGILCGESVASIPGIQVDPRMHRALTDHYLTVGRGLLQETMMHNPESNCLDPMKEFRPCRSACQVTCDTRTRPICPYAGHCSPGCQCKLPYILESSEDLENSKCILPPNCPHNPSPLPTPGKVVYRPASFPFHAQENTDNSMFSQLPHGAVGVGVDRSKQIHCSDPLKNFLTCGSACPAACERLVPACSFQCVSGCFCRTPYVLSDMHDVNSACILPHHCEIQHHKNPFEPEPTLIPSDDKNGFIPEGTTTVADMEESKETTTSGDKESILESTTSVVEKEETKTTSSEADSSPTTLPPITCADPNKEFLSCASSCPLACDNLNAQICSPCVGGCFCKNGFVFESVTNWTDANCVRIDQCPKTTTALSSIDEVESEAIGARLFSIQGHDEIGTFLFSTAADQKIRFDARISHLPFSESKTFVLTIHKYGSMSTDPNCESIGEIVEVNPVYTYPYPNGTLLYLRDVKLPYTASYTFQASSEFAARSVGAVIGRSLALHALSNDESAEMKVGPPLGCATIGILRGR